MLIIGVRSVDKEDHPHKALSLLSNVVFVFCTLIKNMETKWIEYYVNCDKLIFVPLVGKCGKDCIPMGQRFVQCKWDVTNYVKLGGHNATIGGDSF